MRALLTLIAILAVVLVAVVAYYMLVPANWDGVGKLGALALMFPLHLLAVTAVTALLIVLCWRARAHVAAVAFGIVCVATAVMAIVPSVMMWRMAHQNGVSPSLGTYLMYALNPNMGSPQLQRTVVYGTAPDGTSLVLDVWLPQTPPPGGTLRPAVLYIHGGAWIHGARGTFPRWNSWLNDLGYAVFDLEYRMPPPERWRDEVGDVKCALGWIVANAAQYQLDTARISTMGYSAGGNLALLAAETAGDPQLPPSCAVPVVPVRSVINFYGPSDMARLYAVSGTQQFVQDAMRQYIGGNPAQFPDRYLALSPASRVLPTTAPTITFLGRSDRLVPLEQAQVLDTAMRTAGATHEMWLLPAQDHAFDVNWGGFGTQFAREKVAAFLQQH